MTNSNSSQYDIILRFLIDQAAKGNTVAAMDEVERAFKEFNEEIAEAKKQARELKSLARDLGQIFQESFLIGTAITGGIFAAANKYVKDAKEANVITVAWKANQDSLNQSGSRFGAVLAEEALPLMEKAAKLADTASTFLEQHPDIVQAALNTGLVLAGLGAVGSAVTKGIRLYADIAYLTAVAQENAGIAVFSKAVDKFLIGTSEFAGAKGAGGAGSSLLSLGPLAGILSGAALFGAIGRGASNFGAQAFGFQSPEDFWKKMLSTLGVVKTAADGASTSLDKTAANLLNVANSPQFDQVLKAYQQYKQDDLAARRDALGLAKEDQRFAQQQAETRREANQEIRQRRAEIVQRLADLQQSYEQERAQRLADYQARVAEIQANAAQQLKELAAQHAAELRQIQLQRAAKLKELDTQFAEERKRRYAHFIAQIRDLDASLLGETKLKEKYYAQDIQDLDAFLASYRARLATMFTSSGATGTTTGSTGTSSTNTTSTSNILSSWASGLLATFSGLYGSRASGGDIPRTGPYLMHAGETVLSRNTTRAAENVIGGRLTQEALLSSLMGGGSRRSVTINDHRRIDASIPLRERHAMLQEMKQAIIRELK